MTGLSRLVAASIALPAVWMFLSTGVAAELLGRVPAAYDDPEPSAPGFFVSTIAVILLVWYFVVVGLSILGLVKVKQRNTRIVNSPLPSSPPGVTILRPLKGIDPDMDACLSSAFQQDYPQYEIIFCVASPHDPAVAVANRLIAKFPHVTARVLIGEGHYGPNPKINNLAKGYQQAAYDIVWVLDSNMWVSPGTLGRSVAEFSRNPSVQLVHHLPVCLSTVPQWTGNWGSKLDEMFMLTSHSKFYTAINTVAVAPCVMGKSNLYRRSDVDRATGSNDGEGIRVFAQYIAEDNMIAEFLWKQGGRTAMTSDSAVQPLANVDLSGYISRRVRWLRVRKYMVLAATLLEPTTESILCGIIGSFAFSVLMVSNHSYFSWPFFFTHMAAWCLVDYWHFHNLLAFSNVEHDLSPHFASPYYSPDTTTATWRPFLSSWLPVWLLRESMALPIWVNAMLGHKIMWRGRPFRIKTDLTAEEVM